MNSAPGPLTILELSQRLSAAIAATPGVHDVWVVGETSDLRLSGGHCYLELIEKDAAGRTTARLRANIWASVWGQLSRAFQAAAGAPLASGMKVLVRLTASYHAAYGMSATITAIDASYTIGEAVRRRNEIVARLQAEGLIGLNRQIRWSIPALRIAIVSAPGAAGYGDFINQLYNNQHRLAFVTELFPATMQGDRTAPTVLDALDRIAARIDSFDGVVIIRGGGSTSDLAAFDNYDLAARVARYPLPVIVGIGHERDITVLDYVANMRVKTPTAAAEWLIARGKGVLDALDTAATLIYRHVSARIAGNREQLARLAATIPGAAALTIGRNLAILDNAATAIVNGVHNTLQHNTMRLDRLEALVSALSPDAVLSRGFSITVGPDGHTLTNVDNIDAGSTIRTRLANGEITSTVTATTRNTTQP